MMLIDNKGKKAGILSSKHYPFQASYTKQWRNMAVFSLGSNIPKAHKHSIMILESLFMWLKAHSRLHICATSPIWRNPPFGFKMQNDFYNAIMICQSDMGLREIYRLMFYAERRFGRGRKRAFKNAPRTLDIDLIYFNTLRVNLSHLQIPHKHYKECPSVMLPLSFMECF